MEEEFDDVIIVTAPKRKEIDVLDYGDLPIVLPDFGVDTFFMVNIENLPSTEGDANTDKVTPSKGQEGFADDGDPFNDGEVPTMDTIIAWLEDLLEKGEIKSYYLNDMGDDDDTTYQGEYSNEWRDMRIFSDGEIAVQYDAYPGEVLPSGPEETTYYPTDSFDFG